VLNSEVISVLIAEVATRPQRNRGLRMGLVAAAVGLLAGCAGQQATAPPPKPSPSGFAGPGGAAGDPDVALCRAYLGASGDARAPLSPMRTEAVLVPTVDFIELGANQMATRGARAHSPLVAAAMREVVAAQEDLDIQGRARLPAGADLNGTTVMLNPDRLAAALNAADLACAPLLRPGPAGT